MPVSDPHTIDSIHFNHDNASTDMYMFEERPWGDAYNINQQIAAKVQTYLNYSSADKLNLTLDI